MAAGSKSIVRNTAPSVPDAVPLARDRSASSAWRVWLEIAIVFGLLEAVFWTPRSFGHSLLIALEVGSVLWFTVRRHSAAELGLRWPSRTGTLWILALGGCVALAIPLIAIATGHAVPANPNWPKLANLWPYVIWAFAQQFLLQSFFFLRVESAAGPGWALWASTFLFTIAHLPNLALTAMTLFGALFFTEMFRRYRSIYPLGIVHAGLGIAIAYSFPDSLMHHMRVGLSYWQFH